MLTKITEKGPGGLICPYFLCEICGARVTCDGGMVVWKYDPDQPHPLLLFLHKGECDRENKARNGGFTCWQDLGTFLVELTHNSGFTRKAEKKAKEQKMWMAGLGL